MRFRTCCHSLGLPLVPDSGGGEAVWDSSLADAFRDSSCLLWGSLAASCASPCEGISCEGEGEGGAFAIASAVPVWSL